ncbi:DUF167 family protein [Stappia indica]|uniref:UPF0235 protein GH266_11465 n=1 Tax=Stappia indica TaxID=538381 RepID=A0A857C863_9HYPH|nr:DUF167 family protein [Stappia indica]QGZ35069.1 hypothetical protein GH266_11465 [Stappia indica]
MTGDAETAWSVTRDGVRLAVRATPRAARDGIDGVTRLSDGRAVLCVRVRAVADKGAANAAVASVLAAELGLAKRDVRLTAGATARLKTFLLGARDDADAQAIAARLADIAGSGRLE